MPDPLERLTNLVALLLETREPLTLEAISFRLVGQYPESEQARRAAFERDKVILKSVGIPLAQVVLLGEDAGKTGYRIERSAYELGDLGLTDDERKALQVAVATVHLGAGWADDAIMKLGGSPDDEPGLWAISLGASEHLPELYGAIEARRVVGFTYRGAPRRLDPWGLAARGGFWYVVGLDHKADEQRIYRVDRIEGDVATSDETASDAPPDFDPIVAVNAAIDNIGAQDGPAEALVLVDADRAGAAVLEVGEGSIVERRADGSVVLRVPCRNRLVFRAWVLGFVEHAEVLEPAELRSAVVEWLEAMVGHG